MLAFILLLPLIASYMEEASLAESSSTLLPLRDFNDRCLRIPGSRNYHRIPGDGGYEVKIFPYDKNAKAEFERQRQYGRIDPKKVYSESFIPEETYTIQVRPKLRTPLSYEALQAVYATAVPSDTLEIKEPSEGVGKFEQSNCTDRGFGNILLKSSRYSSVVEFEWLAPRHHRYPVKSGSYAQKYSDCIDIRVTIVPASNTRVFMMDSDSLKLTICPEIKRQSNHNGMIGDSLKSRRSYSSTSDINKMHNDASSSGRRCRSSIGSNNFKDISCCCNMAIYQIDIQSDWKRGQHFKDWPEDAGNQGSMPYLSKIIGASHNSNFRMFIPEERASEPVKSLCTNANYEKMERFFHMKNSEILTIIATGSISSAANSNSKRSALLAVNQTHNYISFLSKLMPSPDWCTGLPNVDLCLSNCTWPKHLKIPLHPFDIGQREGNTYLPSEGPIETRRPTPICQIYPEYNYPFTKLDPYKMDPTNVPYTSMDGYPTKVEPSLVPIGHVTLKLIRIVKDGTCRQNKQMMRDDPETSIDWGVSKVPAHYSKPSVKKETDCPWTEWSTCARVNTKDCSYQHEKEYWDRVGPIMFRSLTDGCWHVEKRTEFKKCSNFDNLKNALHKCMQKGPTDLLTSPMPDEPRTDHQSECTRIPWGPWSECKGKMTACNQPRIRSRWRRFRNEQEKEKCIRLSTSYEWALCLPQDIYLKTDGEIKECSLEMTQETVCSQAHPPMYNKKCPGSLKRRHWYDRENGVCRQIDYSLTCHIAGIQKNMEIAASANLFDDLQSCQQFCQPLETCLMEFDHGVACENATLKSRWYFNPATSQCQSFTYQGCGGNQNNFENELKCQRFCNANSMNRFDTTMQADQFTSIQDQETCQLSNWSEWSECEPFDGLGGVLKCQKSRRRHLINGRACLTPASLYEVAECQDCPVSQLESCDHQTIWSKWSHCSRTCGPGIRTRSAVNKFDKQSGKCPKTENIPCNIQKCT